MGKFFCGGKVSMAHSKQAERRGRMTLAWPRQPSVPPSIIGIIVSTTGCSFSSSSTRLISVVFSQRRASIESRPEITMANWR